VTTARRLSDDVALVTTISLGRNLVDAP